MKTIHNPNAITKHNVLRYCGRWGKTLGELQVRFGVKVSEPSVADTRLDTRLSTIIDALSRKQLISNDRTFIYAVNNTTVYTEEELASDGR